MAGMPADRTKAIGMADSRPLASNASEQGRQKNRRWNWSSFRARPLPRVEETSRDNARLAALSSAH